MGYRCLLGLEGGGVRGPLGCVMGAVGARAVGGDVGRGGRPGGGPGGMSVLGSVVRSVVDVG